MRLRILFIVILVAGVAAAVATALSQKQRLQAMSADERRQYLGDKLGSQMSEDQIDQIAAKISEKLDGMSEAVEEAADTIEEAAEAAAPADDAEATSDA